MDRREAIKRVKEFAALISGHFAVKMVILYGSYAKGTAVKHSDIDVAVVVSKIDGDFLEQQARLYKIRRKVDIRIEPILLEDGEDRSGFLEGVLKEGRVVYST